jgi:hypothetical protein
LSKKNIIERERERAEGRGLKQRKRNEAATDG